MISTQSLNHAGSGLRDDSNRANQQQGNGDQHQGRENASDVEQVQ